MDIANYREAEFAKISESEDRMSALQNHLNEVIKGKAFKGSPRCGQFLKYIVDHAIAGHFEMLKERVIGKELFRRSLYYDTSEDAIVRVTASDLRKRLLQHYDRCGAACEIRINLPLGSYIPEILCEHPDGTNQFPALAEDHGVAATPPDSEAAHKDSAPESVAAEGPAAVSPVAAGIELGHPKSRSMRPWLTVAVLSGVLNLVLFGILLFGTVWMRPARTAASPDSVLPWSALFGSQHSTHLIASDPNIAELRAFVGSQISVADYANHIYIPERNTLTPEVKRICLFILRGDKAALVDTQIAVNIAELAQRSSRKIDVQGARTVQISNLKTDDSFVFLGSPRTDPWASLFNDHLDLQFALDKGEEIIRNVHPGRNEQPVYVPTAGGLATGQSFAIIAFIQNPEQNGQVLLLAGINAEGTEAAGKLATDLARLSMTLQKCGISPSGPLKHFELLLRVNTLAGSPTAVDVVACHILPDSAVH